MGMHAYLTCFRHTLVGILFSATVVLAAPQAKPGCPDHCGNVSIPFPFGVGDDCYLNSEFNITCDKSTNPPKPYLRLSDFEVTEISMDGQLNIKRPAASDCFGDSNSEDWKNWFKLKKFTVSELNKFTVVGCDSYAYLRGYRNNLTEYSDGCGSVCDKIDDVDEKSCSGHGCCQIDVPEGLYRVTVSTYSFKNYTHVYNFSPCTYAFVVEQSKFNFSREHLKLKNRSQKFPVVIDWSVDENVTSIVEACGGNNSLVYKLDHDWGFRCRCKEGYEGNPYYIGCHDINECENETLNNCAHKCINVEGSYKCSCPKWHYGDGRKDGKGCELHLFPFILIISCVGVTFIAALVVSSWFYLVLKQRKLMKLKERFFKENGGFLLQQKLSGREGSSNSLTIFTSEVLEKATYNYDESMIIGKGGFGTVYKGVLSDNREVAIKKSTTLDPSQVEQFVNEVLVLSQINHRNVVKLLGCCLETQVPLLVYEFISSGTLFEHIHRKDKSSTFPWEIRLKVASETATALNYLHFEASIPIIHRDVKTTNILLGPHYTAKVSDFGASRFIPLDETQISTMVQGTLGYLDPEYMLTSQLTEKSDVYSFGVVLVELLTGLKPLCFERPEAQRSLAMYFVLSIKHGCLFDIIDSELINQGNDGLLGKVALIAKKCLALKGEERPTMKEVAMELEELLKMENHPGDQVN